MNTEKTGSFIRDLRKEKNLTQQQLAELINVSDKAVSRWETGSNMPDLDLLMEISDLYEVDLREMLNGERKSEKAMDKEMEETVLQVAEYSNAGQERATKVVRVYFLLGILALCVNAATLFMDLPDTYWSGFLKGGTIGLAVAAMIMGLLYTTSAMKKLYDFKMRLIGKEKAVR